MQKIDWSDLNAVIAYAKKLSTHSSMTVMRKAGLKTFSITHTERRDLWDRPDVTVMHQTN